MNGRILSVDPGEKNIGIAISDPSATIASPLCVIKHISREKDADLIIKIALENNIQKIIIGQAMNDDGLPSFTGNKSKRLADVIITNSNIPVLLWDESNSTNEAIRIRVQNGASKKRRRGHLDDIAAAVILQSFLDSDNLSSL